MMDKKHFITLFLLLESFFSSWALMMAGHFQPGNILTAAFFMLSFFFFRHVKDVVTHYRTSKVIFRISILLALIFTACYTLPDYTRYVETLTSPLYRAMILAAVFTGYIFLFFNALLYLFTMAAFARLYERYLAAPPSGRQHRFGDFYLRHTAVSTFFLCMAGWMPYFLYQYPAIMTPDSINQLEQVLLLVPYSNHHPFAHTMVLKLLYSFGGLFTSDMVVRISFYTFFQMCVLALGVTYLITTLKSLGIRVLYCLLITFFYAFVPYHGVYAVTIWKDVLFAAGILFFSVSMLRLYLKITPGNMCVYFLSGLLFCLFRSNGWYAFLLSLPFLLWLFRKALRQMLPLHLGIFLAALIVKVPVMNALHVTQPDFVESLSIPTQQIAYVICQDRNLTEEQWDLVHKVIDTTYIKELYVPSFADNMKELVRAGNQNYLEENKGAYLKLWLELGLTYPADYLHAYTQQTLGYWYPDSFYTVADTEGISASSLGISHTPLIRGPVIVKLKEIAIKMGKMLPIYGLLWSMGILFWVLLFCMGCAFIRKEKWKLGICLPSFTGVMTVLIATPVSADFRYVYFLVFSMPLYCILALTDINR